jgi:methanethiol oxidase
MAPMVPDPTFYPTARLAGEVPAERLAWVTLLAAAGNGATDALGVIDTDPSSGEYGRLVGRVEFPDAGNELHHLGWNACSSHLRDYVADPRAERRFLIVPGTTSSRIHIVDTWPDPRNSRLVKVIERDEVTRKSGYAAPHTVHCGPGGIYLNALGAPDGNGPGGIFMLDHETFEIRGPWEKERGPQRLAWDFWWHPGYDTLITSEFGTPNMVSGGLNRELLLGGEYGNALHIWSLKERTHTKTLPLGDEQQMVLELCPAHNPRRAWGFVCVAMDITNLSSSVFLWYMDHRTREWKAKKVIEIPAEAADAADLAPVIAPFGAVPPLVTDIELSLDDRFLYVSCWGTGELRQYDVSDPFRPKPTGSVRIGGIVRRTAHPSEPDRPLNGGPQRLEISRDGRRVYVTNSLYSPWDAQFYPDGIKGWMAKVDVRPDGGIAFDQRFLAEFGDGMRPHRVRLEGGDASSDSCRYS